MVQQRIDIYGMMDVKERCYARCEMCWIVLFGRSVNSDMRAYKYCPYCGILLELPDGV